MCAQLVMDLEEANDNLSNSHVYQTKGKKWMSGKSREHYVQRSAGLEKGMDSDSDEEPEKKSVHTYMNVAQKSMRKKAKGFF